MGMMTDNAEPLTAEQCEQMGRDYLQYQIDALRKVPDAIVIEQRKLKEEQAHVLAWSNQQFLSLNKRIGMLEEKLDTLIFYLRKM